MLWNILNNIVYMYVSKIDFMESEYSNDTKAIECNKEQRYDNYIN